MKFEIYRKLDTEAPHESSSARSLESFPIICSGFYFTPRVQKRFVYVCVLKQLILNSSEAKEVKFEVIIMF